MHMKIVINNQNTHYHNALSCHLFISISTQLSLKNHGLVIWTTVYSLTHTSNTCSENLLTSIDLIEVMMTDTYNK